MRFKNNNGRCPDIAFCANAKGAEECSRKKTISCFPVSNGKPESKLYLFMLKLLFSEKDLHGDKMGIQDDDKRIKSAVVCFLKTSEEGHGAVGNIIDDAVSSFLIRRNAD